MLQFDVLLSCQFSILIPKLVLYVRKDWVFLG